MDRRRLRSWPPKNHGVIHGYHAGAAPYEFDLETPFNGATVRSMFESSENPHGDRLQIDLLLEAAH